MKDDDQKSLTSSIVYRPEHENIANSIANYFLMMEIPTNTVEVSSNTILDANRESQLLKIIKNSDLIIPILYPSQKWDQEYDDIRHIYESIGNLESNEDTLVFPIYTPLEIDIKNIDQNLVRKPETFFRNIGSYFWKDGLDDQSNEKILGEELNRFLNFKEEERHKVEEKKQVILESTKNFTEMAISNLKRREIGLKVVGYFWSIIGFFCLLAGIYIAYKFIDVIPDHQVSNNWQLLLLSIVKNVIIIVLLIAAARYSFMFSKTFLNESLKNADRIHAIRFGDVYLKLFEKEIKYEEFKEVFQFWNTKGDGYFLTIKSQDFDPELLDKLSDLVNLKTKKPST